MKKKLVGYLWQHADFPLRSTSEQVGRRKTKNGSIWKHFFFFTVFVFSVCIFFCFHQRTWWTLTRQTHEVVIIVDSLKSRWKRNSGSRSSSVSLHNRKSNRRRERERETKRINEKVRPLKRTKASVKRRRKIDHRRPTKRILENAADRRVSKKKTPKKAPERERNAA